MPNKIINSLRGMASLFLILGLAAGGIAYWKAGEIVAQELGARLDVRSSQVRSSVEQQVQAYAEVLYGLRAQFRVRPQLSRQEFKQAYRGTGLDTRLPGIQAMGFAARVPAASRPAFDARLSRELSDNDLGYPGWFRRPEVRSEDAYIVQYIEPVERNALGVGINQGAEAKRRVAIEEARDSGGMTVSGRLRLFVDPGHAAGVVFFMPLYRGGAIPATLEQRRAAFLGVVFLGVRIDEMLREVFGPKLQQEVNIAMYDLPKSAGGVAAADLKNILFDNGTYPLAQALQLQDEAQLPQRIEQVQIGRSRWQIEVTALPALARSTQRWLPLLAALSAVLLSTLVFICMRKIERRRRLAENRASDAEQSLHSREAQLARISDSIDDVLWTSEVPGHRTLFASAAIDRVYGRRAQAFYDNPLLWKECIHPDDLAAMEAAVERLVSTGHETLQYRIVRPDGEIRWLLVKAYFIAGKAVGTGFVNGIATDITAQRHTSAALLRKNRALQTILACDQGIAQAKSEAALLQGVCEAMLANGYRMAWAGVLQRGEQVHVVPVAIAGDHQGYLDSIQDALDISTMASSTIAESLRTCRPVVSNRIADDGRLAPWQQDALQRGFRAKIALPLFDDEQVLGIVNVYAAEEDAFDAEEVNLLQGLANSIALTVQSHRDRLARQDAEARLRLQQRAVEASANPIAISQAQGPDYPVEYVNPAFEQVTGYAAAEMIGNSLSLLCRGELEQAGLVELEKFRAAHEHQRESHAVVRIFHRAGSPLWVDVYMAPVRDESGRVTHFVYAMYDITATRRYQAELEYHANFDMLTGLANRNLLRDRIAQAIARAASRNEQVWIVSINLDRFRFVNDTMGRSAGDTLLQQAAQRLQDGLDPGDTAARVTADEFVLVLSEARDEDAVTTRVQAAMQAIAEPLTVKGHDYFMSCGAGVAMYPADGDHPETLLKHSDIALRRAKELGRNHFQFYTTEMNQRAMERLRLEGDLQHALERQELLLHYQPQVDLRTGRIVGAEALLRWQHPLLGMIPPDRFIRIAEESGLIVPIGTWVMHTACRQNKAWQDAGSGPLRIAVNLSSNQFYQPDLIGTIAAILQETGLPARCLDIELTESLVMHDVEEAVGIMRGIKELGVKLSIDDFGTGYSSLSYLRRFPVDVLKVDQSFVRNVTTDPDQAAITHAIITLARSLRLHVIAEGVETPEQLAYLRRHRCDEIQGFYFSRPLPAADFAQLFIDDKCLPAAEEIPDAPRQTLLIVDDEENVSAAIHRLLRKEGYRILRANSAEQGFTLLAQHDIQVILCDQRMPGMTGTEFLSKVKLMYPRTIRIMLSGYTAIESVIEATNTGAVFRFHTKPWDDKVLRTSITEAFQYHWLMPDALSQA